jgi:cellulose synthase/poly-beta-1,6-N-acetylglucosamine synthase-like glycosyltransferase
MAQELVDSIIVQPGPSTAYRKDALLKTGGWLDNIFGEDGELTNKMARFGYREETEPRSIVYSDTPRNLTALMYQRARWGVAFYHSRKRNLDLLKEFDKPRSIVFLINLISHGGGFGHGLIWAYIASALLIGANVSFPISDMGAFLGFLVIKLAALQLTIYGIEFLLFGIQLKKWGLTKHLVYFPIMRLIGLILPLWVKLQSMEVLLYWSTKWKDYTDESFKDLRQEVKRSIDPGS